MFLLLIQEKQKAGRKTEAGKLGREKKKEAAHAYSREWERRKRSEIPLGGLERIWSFK